MLQNVFLFVALFCSALGAGGAYTTFFSLSPARQTSGAWLRQMQHAIPRIGVPLFAVQPLAALSSLASAVLARGDGLAFWFFAGAFAQLVAAGVITRVVHIPINVRLQTLTEDALPADFDAARRRWWRFHVIRTSTLLLALALLIAGLLAHTRQ